MPNPNTQHWPTSDSYDLIRENMTTKPRLTSVPSEWQNSFTSSEWAAYRQEAIWALHSYATRLSPEDYLNGVRCQSL